MKTTCQSEFKKIKTVFVKDVEAAWINAELVEKQWEELNFLNEPNIAIAKVEYQLFESLLKKQGAEIQHFPKDEAVTMDSIYCRDAAIATDNGMIICNMGKPARMNEPEAEHKAFLEHGIKILGRIRTPGTVEGGDVAWLDEKTLAVGHTYRTNDEGIEQLKKLLNPTGVEVMSFSLPHYKGITDVFHLMSILSPVDKDLAVVYSPLMPISLRNELRNRGYSLVEVPAQEFESMGCNVLAIAPRKCLIVKDNPITKSLLEKAGCEVFEYDGKEISVKGGGGPTCLTRPILREG
ncbi:dimethylarginine dimethylaminohydrolase family protein [soil metagenome]